jgi:hypothetical protein
MTADELSRMWQQNTMDQDADVHPTSNVWRLDVHEVRRGT